jgi:hypothetical protein
MHVEAQPRAAQGTETWDTPGVVPAPDTLAATEPASRITTEAELRSLIGEPLPRVATKERPRLDEMHRRFIAGSPMCLLATADAQGRCDVSPRGDPPGFALVVDDVTLALPERPGNRRVDSLRNILENPHVGLLFLVPGRGDTLRLNGTATLDRSPELLDAMVVKGHRPQLAVRVAVEAVFFHCSKAFLRSQLWEPDAWEPTAVPSRPEIAKRLERPDTPLEELERYYGPAYAEALYTTAPAADRPGGAETSGSSATSG